jgi:hypothetical protein
MVSGDVRTSKMIVVSKVGVADLVRENGGRIYVWTDSHRCCSGNVTYLKTGSAPEPGRRFVRCDAKEFELWFDPGARPAPDELHLEVRRGLHKKRVEAYWNGCVFAI